MIENTRAYDILKQAPFMVPFTSRVKLFTVSYTLTTSFYFHRLTYYFFAFTLLHWIFYLTLQSQLAASKERPGSQALFNRSSFKIRRDHILEDAFNQLSTLPEEDLRGVVHFYITCAFKLKVKARGGVLTHLRMNGTIWSNKKFIRKRNG